MGHDAARSEGPAIVHDVDSTSPPASPERGSRPGGGRPWPRFSSALRSTALTARLGRVVGIAFLVCFVTGLLSHYQYQPWSWLPEPASPSWLYRLTQGIHVSTGIALLPLVLVKLWSVYPNLFQWPPLRSAVHGLERLSVAVLVSSAMVQLVTGLLNVLGWYAWPWSFISVHRFLAYVVIGSLLLHIAVKLPDIRYGLGVKVADGDVLTEGQWQDNPDAHSNQSAAVDGGGTPPPPATEALTRRGLLTATGVGLGLVVVTTVGQTLNPLEPLGLLAPRRPGRGPQGVPVNKTAAQAGVETSALADNWILDVSGPSPYALDLEELLTLAVHERSYPIACVEGWSVGASWRGLRLLDVVTRAGGNVESNVRLISMQQSGSFNQSVVEGPQLGAALLATHVNGERLNVDHGYPLRLIAPNRAGVFNTKWLSRLEIS